ncbi:hypothetical protein SAMN06296020_101389 [Anoxynatronum buryatiense]|uniref:Uncharacterized protein n=1 Tax=Anoxynatronum buryatiense TaxID=489973 RepID=A0AA46AHN5_9CLOT|nr:hypothetical protein SAMN06296020_101389 [Anoxynatronum buryatiense]
MQIKNLNEVIEFFRPGSGSAGFFNWIGKGMQKTKKSAADSFDPRAYMVYCW